MDHETLTDAIRRGDDERASSLLRADPELARSRDGRGVSILLTALYHRRWRVAELVAGHRADLDLHEAAALGRVAVVRRLADGAGLSRPNPDGFTPLHYAAFFGHPDAAAALVGLGADVDVEAANPTRVRPLHSAAASRNVEISRLLLDAGADPNHRQQQGFTALHSAALHGDRELVELLLEAGADPGLPSDDGRSAADFAAEGGHPELAERLSAVPEGGAP